jgi:hypothetical protein
MWDLTPRVGIVLKVSENRFSGDLRSKKKKRERERETWKEKVHYIYP